MLSKILAKRALKSIGRNKLFVGLMIVLVFIASLTYTLFQSMSNSFSSSYDNVVTKSALHDLVIKENFKLASSDEPVVGIYDNATQRSSDLNITNLQAKATKLGATVNNYRISLTVRNDYSAYGEAQNQISVINFMVNNDDWNAAYNAVMLSADALKNAVRATLENRLADRFTSGLATIYAQEMVVNNSRSLAVAATDNNSAFKVVQYNDETPVNKMAIYDGSRLFTAPFSDTELHDELIRRIKAQGKNPDEYTFNTIKGYRVTAQDVVGNVLVVNDASAYQAIISPSYANATGKQAISMNDFLTLAGANDFYDKLATDANFRAQYENNLVWVDRTPYFVIGVGVTPDFIYPIVDAAHPVVNVEHQGIVYVNERGFARINDAFRTAPHEDYISVRFLPTVPGDRRAIIEDELESLIRTGRIAPSAPDLNLPTANLPGLKMVTAYNDNSDQYLLTANRTALLGRLENTIGTISYVTTTLLAVFVSLIILMIFSVSIIVTRRSLAALLALGYSRSSIASSMAVLGFVLGIIPSLLGYLAGFFLQYYLINQFSDFWTIPTYGESFSWLSLVIVIGIPTLFLLGIIWGVAFYVLRHPIPVMLRDSVSDNSHIVAKILGPLRKIGIKTKTALSLTLRNSGRLLLITGTTTISAIAILTGISTIGGGSSAYAETAATTNYEYKIDLVTPTVEGGEYEAIPYDTLSSLVHTETYEHNGIVNTNAPHWHVPGAGDMPYALAANALSNAVDTNALMRAAHYLDNKIQNRYLLDDDSLGVNPWTIASRLMPDNQLNLANEDWEFFNRRTAGMPALNHWDKLYDILLASQNDANARKPYLISYRNPIVDSDDEEYTYIDTQIALPNNANVNYRVIGVKPDTKMYNYDLTPLATFPVTEGAVPVLIGKYVAENYGWTKGTTIAATVRNHASRNLDSFGTMGVDKVNLVVAGIVNGYADGTVITLQDFANKTIGLSEHGFNGVLTKHHTSALLSSLPLYSPSGIYLATDTINVEWSQVLTAVLANPTIWPYGNEIAHDVGAFIAKYSSTPLVSSINRVDWRASDEFIFGSVSNLSMVLITTIEIISIILSIIFTIIITTLIARAVQKRVASLWALGYRKSELIKIFLAKYMFPLFASLAISIPVTIGILSALRVFIMHFGHVLIPFSLTVWAPFAVLGISALIFLVSTLINVFINKPTRSLSVLKGGTTN